ncbi:MAG: CtsR family transcriptional regulator [Bacillota bacterium]
MATLSDDIERYISSLLQRAEGRRLEIQRVALASLFRCVPSQINYVLQTRFTPERGYIVESRRGEGGYIRIIKVQVHSRRDLLLRIYRSASRGLTPGEVRGYLDRLREESIVTPREARMIRGVLADPKGDEQLSENLRGHMFQRVIRMLLTASSDR